MSNRDKHVRLEAPRERTRQFRNSSTDGLRWSEASPLSPGPKNHRLFWERSKLQPQQVARKLPEALLPAGGTVCPADAAGPCDAPGRAAGGKNISQPVLLLFSPPSGPVQAVRARRPENGTKPAAPPAQRQCAWQLAAVEAGLLLQQQSCFGFRVDPGTAGTAAAANQKQTEKERQLNAPDADFASRGGVVWVCTTCTLLNEDMHLVCDACGSQKPL